MDSGDVDIGMVPADVYRKETIDSQGIAPVETHAELLDRIGHGRRLSVNENEEEKENKNDSDQDV